MPVKAPRTRRSRPVQNGHSDSHPRGYYPTIHLSKNTLAKLDGEPPRSARETPATALADALVMPDSVGRAPSNSRSIAGRVRFLVLVFEGVANNIASAYVVNRARQKSFSDLRELLTPAVSTGKNLSASSA